MMSARRRCTGRPLKTGWGTRIAAALAFSRAGMSCPSFVLAVMTVGLAGCARIEAPRGGPEDREPPRIVDCWPDSGAVGVPLGDSLAFVFSEPVDRRSIEDAFFLTPPVEYRERRWEGQTWILRLREPLRADRTYALLLGVKARDRHQVPLAVPWSAAFSTGESLDTGRLAGRVIGQRYPGKSAFVYAWPWEAAPPDTSVEGFARDPLRLGQADAQGAFTLAYLPRGRPLRICAHYDPNGNRSFDPGRDRWSCLEEAVVLADTGAAPAGVELFFADADEPGRIGGGIVDSACIASSARRELARVRAARDSLRLWLAGVDVEADEEPHEAGMLDTLDQDRPAPLPRLLTADDSVRVGSALLRFDELFASAAAESAFCAQPLIAQLTAGDTTVVREATGESFQWTDVPPAIYRLRGFRDLNGNRAPDDDEPQVAYPYALEVRPLRELKDLKLILAVRTAVGEGGAEGDAEGGAEGGVEGDAEGGDDRGREGVEDDAEERR